MDKSKIEYKTTDTQQIITAIVYSIAVIEMYVH